MKYSLDASNPFSIRERQNKGKAIIPRSTNCQIEERETSLFVVETMQVV
jgi:hypothetical protein